MDPEALAPASPRPEWLIGVTGTNGKTTTSALVGHLLGAAGWRVAVSTTVGFAVAGVPHPAERLVDVLEAARGCRAVVQETTSYALQQGLARTVPFDAAVFTNLTHDHLDLHHGSFEHYLAAKAQLFLSLQHSAQAAPIAVLPAHSPATPLLAEVMAPRVVRVTWGWAEDGPADVVGSLEGGQLSIGGVAVSHPLVGRHLAENLLAAVALVTALGLPLDAVLAAAGSFSPVAGRFERVNPGERPVVVVDYAHSPDALERTLVAAREQVRGKVWVVFGCGGERDPAKRPLMGTIAARLADEVVVTTDNPRTEPPDQIALQILSGMPAGRAHVVHDRALAIHTAVSRAGADDLVLVAGKGHENLQIVAGTTLPFDDRAVARAALAERSAGGPVRE